MGIDCHVMSYRSGDEEKLNSILTPLNVNSHAGDGRKVTLTTVTVHACLPIVFHVFSVEHSSPSCSRLQPSQSCSTSTTARG